MAQTPEPDEHLKREAASSFANAFIRDITFEEAKTVILKYEYLKNKMGTTQYALGLFFRHPVTGVEYLAGVECFGRTSGSNTFSSICGREHEKQAIALVRGACVHWAPNHSASWFINRACEQMVKLGFNIFIAYADRQANEIGTVYQASRWDYIGRGGIPTILVRADREIDSKIVATMVKDRGHGLPGKDAAVEDHLKWIDRMRAEGRIVKGKIPYEYVEKMTRGEARAKLITEGVIFKRGIAKHRYIHFSGDRRTVRELRKALKFETLPYPKRVLDGDPL